MHIYIYVLYIAVLYIWVIQMECQLQHLRKKKTIASKWRQTTHYLPLLSKWNTPRGCNKSRFQQATPKKQEEQTTNNKINKQNTTKHNKHGSYQLSMWQVGFFTWLCMAHLLPSSSWTSLLSPCKAILESSWEHGTQIFPGTEQINLMSCNLMINWCLRTYCCHFLYDSYCWVMFEWIQYQVSWTSLMSLRFVLVQKMLVPYTRLSDFLT